MTRRHIFPCQYPVVGRSINRFTIGPVALRITPRNRAVLIANFSYGEKFPGPITKPFISTGGGAFLRGFPLSVQVLP